MANQDITESIDMTMAVAFQPNAIDWRESVVMSTTVGTGFYYDDYEGTLLPPFSADAAFQADTSRAEK